MSFDLADLAPLVQQLVFGRTDPTAAASGGIMAACGLSEAQVVAGRLDGLFAVHRKTFFFRLAQSHGYSLPACMAARWIALVMFA